MCRQDLPALFAPAAWARFNGISAATITPRQAVVVQVSGLDAPELLMRWLRELLSLHDTQRFMC